MNIETFINALGAEFYTGVPDSQLKALCDYLIDKYGTDGKHHIIAANEGNCTSIAAGYHLATGKVPVVYMQNSGIGNIINPVASLLNNKVYAIPCIFVVGWRGEPGIHDEPQHIFQGEITIKLLEDVNITTFTLDKFTTEETLAETMKRFDGLLKKGKQVAFVVKKDALIFEKKLSYQNKNMLLREDIIKHIVSISQSDPIVSTTGKTSRELFEIRESNGQSHCCDFLTVGSMGHSSSIALGIAMQKPEKKIWIIDGDGSALMHMGSMAVIASQHPENIIHIVINNEAHESVGGQPTVMNYVNLVEIAKGCGYESAVCVDNSYDLDKELNIAKNSNSLSFIEIKCAIGARNDLGRPTTTTLENKEAFMKHLGK